jgi:hypothetical protein
MVGDATENMVTAIVMASVTAKRMLTVNDVFGLRVGDSPAVRVARYRMDWLYTAEVAACNLERVFLL